MSSQYNNAGKILVEKVIRALTLLEGLAVSGLDFCFKGGTATISVGLSKIYSIKDVLEC